ELPRGVVDGHQHHHQAAEPVEGELPARLGTNRDGGRRDGDRLGPHREPPGAGTPGNLLRVETPRPAQSGLNAGEPAGATLSMDAGPAIRRLRLQAQNMCRRMAMLASSPSDRSTLIIDEPP